MQASALAIGERVSLLKFAPGSGRLQLEPLALAGVSHAAPLWQAAEGGSPDAIRYAIVLYGCSSAIDLAVTCHAWDTSVMTVLQTV